MSITIGSTSVMMSFNECGSLDNILVNNMILNRIGKLPDELIKNMELNIADAIEKTVNDFIPQI